MEGAEGEESSILERDRFQEGLEWDGMEWKDAAFGLGACIPLWKFGKRIEMK